MSDQSIDLGAMTVPDQHRRTRQMRRNTFGLGALVLAATLSLTACSAAATPVPATPAPTAAASADAMMGAFGSACSAVPTTGMGSFAGMAQDTVATAASHNPVLTTLVTAVTAAGLGDTLNSSKGITVFAPTNDAFAAMDQATLKSALADPKGLLTTVLTYHVIGEQLSPDKLAGTHKSLQGGDVTVTGSGQSFTVNGKAMVVCGNVHTANATVYIIDQVLLPPAK
jgi:uncharacterized surface protein with fasciclin (FAS1) repeats